MQDRRFDPRHIPRRRLVAGGLVVAAAAAVAAGALVALGGGRHDAAPASAARVSPLPRHVPLPAEVRGVHVTMSLASLPGRLEQYVTLAGLNTVELDVKDESGRLAFWTAAPPLARATGAADRYYDPRAAAELAHRHGVYLIGRVVAFEDPVVAERRPAYAIRTTDGGVWHTSAGLAWANPYSRAYWAYLVGVASAAARAGFDEIQFDYVRFPTDGDLSTAVFPGKRAEPMATTVARFLRYASTRLHRLGVRVSADVFGLSATRDLGIGQRPRQISKYLDAIYPMVYPSHYNAGEYDLPDPSADPGRTVADSLRDFRAQLRGRTAKLIPWLQDFSLGRTYGPLDVRAQITAARLAHTRGFMLWNADGIYTPAALSPS